MPRARPRPGPSPTPARRIRSQPLPRRPAVADDLPLWLWPADILTRAADALLGLFGPPGRFFRSGFGKNLLGLAGLGLLLYTAAHLAQVQGWVALPVPVPWPR